MRLVDADEVVKAVHDEFDECLVWDESGATTADEFENIILQLPTVDAEEVVRCKDCIHRFKGGENVVFNCCELNHNKVQADDWFCADGERREDETD